MSKGLLKFTSPTYSGEWPVFLSLIQVSYFTTGHSRALYFSSSSSKAQIFLFTPLMPALSNFFHSKPSNSNSITHPTPPPHNLPTTSSLTCLIQILHYTLSSLAPGISPFFFLLLNFSSVPSQILLHPLNYLTH